MEGIHREISSTIADAITYWQLEMKRREAGDDPRAIFNKAKAELRDLLKVDATVHPELNGAGQEAADKALKAMAEECGIAPDEALIDDDDGHDDEQDDQGGESDKPKQADILVSQAKQAKLFHTPAPDWEEYADIIVGGRRETHRIRGKSFRLWLRHQYFLKTKSGCSNEALQVAVETIAAFARFEGEKHEAHCRIAELAGGSTSTWAMRRGVRLKSPSRAGRLSMSCRCGSGDQPAPSRCRFHRRAVASNCSDRSAT